MSVHIAGGSAGAMGYGAHAIVRRGDEVLLVSQHPSFWDTPFWSLPGGTAEQGELVCEAAAREVEEETGLRITSFGCVAWIVNVVRPAPDLPLLVTYVEAESWEGELVVDDPAGVVTEARWVSVPTALEMLADSSPHVTQPAVEYLAGREPAGRMWCYRGALPTPELAARL